MQWIYEAPPSFDLQEGDKDDSIKLIVIIDDLKRDINLLISEFYPEKTRKIDWSIDPKGRGLLTQFEIDAIDAFIRLLDEAPIIDHVALWENSKEKRLLQIDRMLSEGLSYGEATNAPPILNQSEESFRAALKTINNDLVEQIKIIEHFLPRWHSFGDFPPPYYAWRIAVILRKSKEHGREREFLRIYLRHFRSSLRGSRGDERLVERAAAMGLELPPI